MTPWDRGHELRLRQAVREADAAELALAALVLQILLVAGFAGLASKHVWVTGGVFVVLGIATVPLTGRRIVAGLLGVLWTSSIVRLGHGLYVMEDRWSGEGVLAVAGIALCTWFVAMDIAVSSRRLDEDLNG